MTEAQNNLLKVSDTLSIGKTGKIAINFIGKGNIWLKNTYKEDTVSLARYIISKAIFRTEVGQLSLIGYDAEYSGVFAPFSSLTSGANKQLELIKDNKDLEHLFEFIGVQIQAVQNVIQGRTGNLIDFRKSINRPVESFKLVVLFMNFQTLSLPQLAKLSTLLQRGPASGISFLLIPSNNKLPENQLPTDLDENIKILSAQGNSRVVMLSDDLQKIEGDGANYTPLDVENIIKRSENFIDKIKSAPLPTVMFNEISDLQHFWTESSENGVTFSVGKYGDSTVEVTIGDEVNQRHNALITGAVGQGKSNLLSVIIHSLCQRYSPKELQLYLLDFKEGVSLKPFVNIGQEVYLPHAKVVGLESDIDLGKAVLDDLYRIYLNRMKIFKNNDVKSLKELRIKFPHKSMQRIVVIIDEFQLMFGDDMTFGQKMVDLLEKSVRLFRAAGIHFILASQSISGNMFLQNKKDSLFSQIPIRISHKNSLSESHNTLGMGNDAAAYLRAREAIVNLDYGEVSQNKKTVVAWANETVLSPLRKKWYQSKEKDKPPYIFESDKKIELKTIFNVAPKSSVVNVLLGEKISIRGETVSIPLNNESGKNIVILGSPNEKNNAAEGLIEAIMVSCAQTSKNPHFYICDFRDNEAPLEKKFPQFVELLKKHNIQYEDIPRDKFIEKTAELLANPEENTSVFGLNMDKLPYEKDPYGLNQPLKEFVEEGPSKGMHFIGWWIKATKFNEQAPKDAFNTKIFLRIDEASVRSLTNPFVKWNGADNKALVSDEVELTEETVFIPYSPIK